ncbi:MAG TPA: tetratricopeptide repeat protein [Gemmatimonadaceae bacterium]
MSNIDKLKKKAAEFEQKKQYEKALELYQQVLDFSRTSDEERDVPLYNRVGDLHFRLGNSEEAISYYEKAVDLYAEGGFFNNAIALCNKILRYSPNRSVAYYKLGLISARKGFNSDAKQNFLEYADRMQKVGKLDEAFRALKEFADLCPGQDDVRLMLAEQLARADRKPEALEQLQLLYDTLDAEGRTAEAAAAVERMKTIDPGFTPKRSVTPRRQKKDGLVFLDLGYDEATSRTPASGTPRTTPGVRTPPASTAEIPTPPDGLELTSLADAGPSPRAASPAPVSPAEFELIVQKAASQGEVDGRPVRSRTPSAGGRRLTPSADMKPLERAPLVAEDSPAEVVSQPEQPAKEQETSPAAQERAEEHIIGSQPGAAGAGDASVPVLHETALNDPLAGLDVISSPQIDDEPATLEKQEFVDLAQWLAENRTPQSTRMVARDDEPEDNQQKDFEEMLEKFKLGVARSVDDADFDSHYDLGIAFREMGLIDEAISAFQKATRGSSHRVRASESLGECFIERGQPAIAVTVLERLIAEPGLTEESLIGVFYLLGRAAEELDKAGEASAYYHRVIALDMGFRDASHRLAMLPRASR